LAGQRVEQTAEKVGTKAGGDEGDDSRLVRHKTTMANSPGDGNCSFMGRNFGPAGADS
jgi:hypothetical protein